MSGVPRLISPSRSSRSTYRHGDLRRALLEAGIGLARSGGPDAVVLREATRRAGVAPNAAYRHFASREALLRAVRAAALLALANVMQAELAALPEGLPPEAFARASVRAVGTGYLKFAQAESGLFRTAFAVSGPPAPDEIMPGDSGPHPFALLGAALDRLVTAGLMPPERRPGAELLAWSAVHGLAMLVIDGPLGASIGPRMPEVGQRLLDMVEKGL